MLEVRNITKRFESGFIKKSEVRAVDDVSFTVGEDEVFGLIGGSGSGKTTMSRIIMGFVKPDAGSIRYDDRDLTRMTNRQ